jgi:tetrahydromethanopterin S-methyltransferase subunit G
MTTLTIEIPEKVEKTLSELVQQLGGKVIKSDPGKVKADKLTRKEKEFLKGLEEAVEFVNMHQEGRVKAKTIDEFLNEL